MQGGLNALCSFDFIHAVYGSQRGNDGLTREYRGDQPDANFPIEAHPVG